METKKVPDTRKRMNMMTFLSYFRYVHPTTLQRWSTGLNEWWINEDGSATVTHELVIRAAKHYGPHSDSEWHHWYNDEHHKALMNELLNKWDQNLNKVSPERELRRIISQLIQLLKTIEG